MKGKFTKLIAALALLVFMTPSLAGWGQTRDEVTITMSEQGWSNDNAIGSGTLKSDANTNSIFGYTSGTGDDGASEGPKYFTSGTSVRFYSKKNGEGFGNWMQISVPENTTITGVELTVSGVSYANTTKYNVDGGSDETLTWTGTTGTVSNITATTSFKFRNAYQSTSDNKQLRITKIKITYTQTGVTPTCATPTFTPAAGTYTEAQDVTINCTTEGATIYYTLDGTDPTTSSSVYNSAISISTNTTVKAMATAEGYNNSAVATAVYNFVTIEHAGTLEDPYTVADARNAIDANTGVTGVYATGIVSQVDSYNSNYNSINYWISDDGTTTNQLEAYGGLSGIEGWTFSSKDDITVGATVVIYGDLTKYNTTYEFAANNELVSYTAPTYPIIEVEEALSVAYDATSGEIEYSITNPVEGQSLTATSTAEWISDITVGESAVTFACTANEGTADRTATVTLSYEGAENVNVTVTQGHHMAPGNWVLTDLADLTASDVFVIVGNNGNNYALPNDGGTTRPSVVAVTVFENTLPDEVADNLQWNLSVNNSGYVFYPAGSASTWLYCTNSNDGVRVGTGDAKHFSLSENGYLTTTETNDQRYIGIYNSQDWRCYTSEGGNIANQTFAFYKKVSDDVTYTKSVAAYEGDGGYVLIASPVCSVAPSTDNGFLTSEYDLYAFDQAQEQEWRNYEASSFNLVSGKGYMYASSSATTLTFTGQPYNGNGMIPLDYTEDVPFAGWNLVGNPYAVAATPNKPYYRLNDAGSEVSASTESSAVDAMEGVFVVATEAGQTVSFSTANSGSKGESIALNVMKNRGTVIDRAIVRFGEGEQLPKFQLFESSTKLYISQGNSDYAIVRSAAEGEMPVNFKAKENGTYTISVNTENVEMDYLHLIDNMTGTDVDLLQTPSYTFEATTRDYASRFRLVFNANDNNAEGNANFAYFNGSEWQISNIGEATLQVVDVMGRIVKNVALEGNATVSINETPGVYMMRLLNGNDVKVQKVVIR
ncbi:MAG: chitobiase/beta-hexosaminidase C-terminal domain-containing protein [bacterium]|nr:chitobiase/beta-hexosaminidase C-terminal domain-containing protein [bacterium]